MSGDIDRFVSKYWDARRDAWVERRHQELRRGHVRVLHVPVRREARAWARIMGAVVRP